MLFVTMKESFDLDVPFEAQFKQCYPLHTFRSASRVPLTHFREHVKSYVCAAFPVTQ